jgi:hypothetical protein
MWLQPGARSGAEIVRAGCDVQQNVNIIQIPSISKSWLEHKENESQELGCPCGVSLISG